MKNRIGKSKTKREKRKAKKKKKKPIYPQKAKPYPPIRTPFSDQSGYIRLLQLPPSKLQAVKLAIADETTNTVASTHREQPDRSRD